MAAPIVHPVLAILLDLAAKQHGVVLRRQLVKAGLSASAIKHRIARGDLPRSGVASTPSGARTSTRVGGGMAATLVCGQRAALSHESAAELWQLRRSGEGPIHVSVPQLANHRRLGIALHRRRAVGHQREHVEAVLTAVAKRLSTVD